MRSIKLLGLIVAAAFFFLCGCGSNDGGGSTQPSAQLLPNMGQQITPLAPPGSRFESLNPDLVGNPKAAGPGPGRDLRGEAGREEGAGALRGQGEAGGGQSEDMSAPGRGRFSAPRGPGGATRAIWTVCISNKYGASPKFRGGLAPRSTDSRSGRAGSGRRG